MNLDCIHYNRNEENEVFYVAAGYFYGHFDSGREDICYPQCHHSATVVAIKNACFLVLKAFFIYKAEYNT